MALPLQGRQRRPITILFADIVGSTSLAEDMDAEDWTAIIQPALDRMLAAVKRYEGHVAQVQGDGVLAFFGAPEAHEDDPERAVRAGLDMVDAIGEYVPRLPGREEVQLQIRVGVNTGTAVVGAGDGIGQDYTAFGDAVNVAARIQGEARPGAVLITADTHAALRDVIEAEHRGAISVKGKAQPIDAWEVVSWKGSLRRRRGLAGLSSPMVGRDAELARLAALLPILQAGRGRMAVIIGEPGIGKSRLLRELRDALRRDAAPDWHEGRCLSYGLPCPTTYCSRFSGRSWASRRGPRSARSSSMTNSPRALRQATWTTCCRIWRTSLPCRWTPRRRRRSPGSIRRRSKSATSNGCGGCWRASRGRSR
ncbi:MAG: adenylate/guanylate cyclase domain-containing protein [Chloroflexi bacterium]|nr:adenylate/guanylate cyclase domain-containing protein [Chloroflexota bacterium]